MARFDYRDIIGGLLMSLFGLFMALYATEHYRIGTVSQMGPGMFPMLFGWVLVGLGMLLIVPAFFRRTVVPAPKYRVFVACLAAMGAFALLSEHVGIIPALLATVTIAVFADNKLGFLGAAALAIGVTLVAWLIFFVGLQMTAPLFTWDWRFSL